MENRIEMLKEQIENLEAIISDYKEEITEEWKAWYIKDGMEDGDTYEKALADYETHERLVKSLIETREADLMKAVEELKKLETEM